jgi:hypothetical protein
MKQRRITHQPARWLVVLAAISLVAIAPQAGAQVPNPAVATGESVFSAPGLGGAVSVYESTVIAGGVEAVEVYELGVDGWAHTARVTATDGAPGDEFGATVYLSGAFALIGAPGVTVAGHEEAGAAYVFQHLTDGTWVQRARLVSGSPSTNAHFGASVAVSAQLFYAIGSPGAGLATIFEPVVPGVSWRISGELSAPDLRPDEARAAGFGASTGVEVTFDPYEVVAVGAPGADGSGAVYTYRRDGSTWVLDEKLVQSPRIADGHFGQTLSIEATSLLIGAPGIRSVVGVLIDETGQYVELGDDVGGPGFGTSVGSGAARGIAGDPAVRVAYIYGRDIITGGLLLGTLVPRVGTQDDGFGASADIHQHAVVGAPGAHAIHIFDLGTTDVTDHASLTLSRGLSYSGAGEVYGQVVVTRHGQRVVSVTGRGRLLTGTTPAPFVAFDLHQLAKSPKLIGSITIRDPGTGFEHSLFVITSAAASETRVSGSGIGFDIPKAPRGLVKVRWTVDDLSA